MRKLGLALLFILLPVSHAMAVSVFELQQKCGDDAKAYCEGVSYGDEMTACFNQHYKQLQSACKLVIDRVNKGEKVSLF